MTTYILGEPVDKVLEAISLSIRERARKSK